MGLESALTEGAGNLLSSNQYSRRQILTVGAALLGLIATPNISSAEAKNPPIQNLPPPRVLTPGHQILQLFDQSCILSSEDKARDLYKRLEDAGLSKKARLVTEGTLIDTDTGNLITMSYVEYCPSKYGFVMDPRYSRIKLFRAPYENAARNERADLKMYTAIKANKKWDDVLRNKNETPRGDLILRVIERLVETPYAWDSLPVEGIPDRVVSVDNWQPPRKTRRIKRGDCEDKSFVCTDDLVQEGFVARWVLGLRESNRQDSGHVWTELVVPGTTSDWIIEATTPDIIRKNSRKPGAFYEIPLDLNGSTITKFKKDLDQKELVNLFRYYRDTEYETRRNAAIAAKK